MKEKKKWVSIAATVLIAAVMIYLFNDIFTSNYNKYETVTTNDIVEQNIIGMKAFVIRDEKYIDGNASGTVVPLVEDGKRVASGDAVARVCASEQDAADYAHLTALTEERDRYIALSNQTQLNALDIEKLNREINDSYADFLSDVGAGDCKNLSDQIENLENNLVKKQILVEKSVDFSKKIEKINAEISAIESKKISPKQVTAPASGYYISTLDGYENAFAYSDVKNMTVASVDELLKAEARTVSDKMGKIVGSYKWYIVSTIESKYAKILSVGKNLKINVPFYGLENISVKIESISEESDGRVAIVLSCNLMNETYANLRDFDAELVLKEYSGYKVPKNSVRSLDVNAYNKKTKKMENRQLNVVYILRGDIMNARAVDIIYTPKDKDYVIVSDSTENVLANEKGKVLYFSIKRYDEVIVKGKELEDGKSVG